jgi:heat shock protein HslJ
MHSRLSIAIAALLAAACAGSSQKEPPPKVFTGTTWQVVLQLPLAGEQPYVRFGDGRMEGFSGCNRFTAQYVEDAVGARAIAIRRIDVPNRHICEADNQAIESRLLETLQSVSTYLITGDTMIMSGSAGSLRFAAKESATSYGAAPVPGVAPVVTANSLVGTRWVGVDPTVEKDPPVFEFVTEQRITGYTGCNMMSGEWHMQNGEIHLGRVVVTKRMCVGPGADAEKHVLAVMLEKSRFRVEGEHMLVTTPEGASYEFKRSRASASTQ